MKLGVLSAALVSTNHNLQVSETDSKPLKVSTRWPTKKVKCFTIKKWPLYFISISLFSYLIPGFNFGSFKHNMVSFFYVSREWVCVCVCEDVCACVCEDACMWEKESKRWSPSWYTLQLWSKKSKTGSLCFRAWHRTRHLLLQQKNFFLLKLGLM